MIWEITYSRGRNEFWARPARCAVTKAVETKGNRVVLSGDKRRCSRARSLIAFGGDMGKEAERRLLQLLNERRERTGGTEPFQFDMEPFEVVRDMLLESRTDDTIGGAPQLVRIDQHINARAVGVYWPSNNSGQVTLLGRPALGYDNLDAWVLDPNNLELHHPHFNPAEADPEDSPIPEE